MADQASKIVEQMDDVLYSADASTAFDIMKQLEVVLRATPTDSEEYSVVDGQRASMAFVALRYLSDRSIEQLFEGNALEIISLPPTVDIIETIKGRLLQEFYMEGRNTLRDKWFAALGRCSQRLGTKEIMLGSEAVPPTIANWLKLYRSSTGEGRVTNVQNARFFAQDKSVQALSKDDQAKLRNLINLHNFLQKRSEELEAYEESAVVTDDQGRVFILQDGKSIELYDTETRKELKRQAQEGKLSLLLLTDLIRAYPDEFGEFANKPIRAAVSLTNLTPQDVAANIQKFFADQRQKFAHRVPASGVPLPNRTAALVAMLHKAMSRGQEADMVLSKEILQFVVSDQERLTNFMRHSSVITLLQNELPPSIGEKNKEVVRQSPTSPMAMQALLQIVFAQRFKLSPEEAAWQSFDVLQRLPAALKELKTVVTYDPGQNKLVWRY